MAIVTAVNSTSPNAVKWASTDADVYERETQLAGLAENYDLHDHDSAKCLGVKRVQTTVAPTAAGHVRISTDEFQWWASGLGNVQTAVRIQGTQSITGLKDFTAGIKNSGTQDVPAGGAGNSAVHLFAGDSAAQTNPTSGGGSPAKITAFFKRTQTDDFIGYGIQNWLTHNGNISACAFDNRIVAASGNRDHIVASQNVSNAGGGTFTHAYGVLVADLLTGGTVTNHYSFYAETPVTGSTITNNYGVYVKDQRGIGSSLNRAIHTDGGDVYISNGLISTALAASPGVGSNGVLAALGGTIQEAGSGTHSVMATLQVSAPTITNAGASSSNGAALYIPNAGSGATANYALMIGGGTSFFGSANLMDGETTIRSSTATPAGGSTSARLLFGTTSGFGVYYGSGAPTVSAAQGSLYLRSDGSSTSTRLYVNTNGTTGWTNFTSAA